MRDEDRLLERAQTFTLASILTAYPVDDVGEILAESRGSLASEDAAGALARVLDAPLGVDDLRSAYLDLFERGKQRASLYETEYGHLRGMAKGHDLADIAGFYMAFGLEVSSGDAHEMADHIAVELEFYALLLLKQEALKGDQEGSDIVEGARRKFLVDHLGRVSRAVAERREVIEDAVYGPLFAWCRDIVDAECALLGVEPAPLNYYADPELQRDMECGSVHLPVVQ